MKLLFYFSALTVVLGLPARAINFDVPTGDTQTYNDPIINEGIAKLGGGTLILGGTEDNAGSGANVVAGILELAKASSPSVHALGGTGSISVQDGAILRIAGTGGDQIFDELIISLNTSGILDLNGRSERVRFYNGSGQILSSSGTGTFIFGIDFDEGSNAMATFSDGGGVLNVTKVGTGLWTLGGASTHSGTTTIAAGTLRSGLNDILSDASTIDVQAGATLQLSGHTDTIGGLAGAGTVLLGDGGALTVGANHTNTTFDGTLTSTATGIFNKTGNGTLTLGGTSDNAFLRGTVQQGTLVLAKQSSASVHALGGDTTIHAGATLRLDGTGGDQIFDPASLEINGTLDLQDRTETIASFSGSGAIDLGSGTLTAGNSANQTFSGILSGGGSLVKTGSGTLTLSGTNSHTGTITSAGGTLRLGSDDAIPATSTLAVNSGATIDLNGYSVIRQSIGGTGGTITLGGGNLTLGVQDATSTLAAAVNGPGTFTKTGNGTLTLTGFSDIQGPVLIESGTLAVTSSIGTSAALTIAAGATLAANIGTEEFGSIFLGSLSGSGAIIRDPALGLPPKVLSVGSNHASTTYSGNISAANLILTKQGEGALTLSGTNTFFGLRVNQGTVVLASDGAFTPGAILILEAMGTLDSGGRSLNAVSVALNGGTLALGGGSLTIGGGTINGEVTITGGGGLTKTSGDLLEIYAPVNTSGPLLFEDGATVVYSPDSLPDAAAVTVSAPAALTFFNSSETLGSLAGSGNLVIEESTLTVGGASSTTFSGEISGTNGHLVKGGNGTLTLSGANSYTGNTQVNSGTLLVSNLTGSATGSGDVTVVAGAALGGTGILGGNLTLDPGAFLAMAPGATLTLEGTLSIDAAFGVANLRDFTGSPLDWNTLANGTYTLLEGSNLPTFSTANISNFGPANAYDIGGGRSAYFTNGSLALVVIPEPSTTLLLGLGALTALALRRRCR